ncbi:MAG TPA: 3-deoxy-manno-octulosonate-8-phosphatase KdsC [Halanaerobiales bacterium]|nr:3-deoxy-manno-octulosonate-8-phosphatase KdsC [Halanaerobiales bacterium]
MNKSIIKKALKIKLFITDVDGVLTDGSLILGNNGEEFKSFNSQDGMGIKLLQKNDIKVAIITGRSSKIVENRAEELDIKEVYQGIDDKIKTFNNLLDKYSLNSNEVSYIGDDLNDLPVLNEVGLSFTVSNGVDKVKENVDYITEKSGGKGAVREAAELILNIQSDFNGGEVFDTERD